MSEGGELVIPLEDFTANWFPSAGRIETRIFAWKRGQNHGNIRQVWSGDITRAAIRLSDALTAPQEAPETPDVTEPLGDFLVAVAAFCGSRGLRMEDVASRRFREIHDASPPSA